jgi:hypothetical protein
MALDDAQLKNLIVDLLTTPSKRDNQRKIGASGMGDPCPYCLAHKLLATKQRQGRYWLGGKIGTAIHALLESEELKHIVKPQSNNFKALKGALVEQTISLGVIPGYGEIFSKPDLFLVAENHLVDHKTSKRAKVEGYALTGTIPVQYIYQGQLYARGLEDAGYAVEKISFVFINRDGTNERDVRIFTYDYDRSMADEAWKRTEDAWNWLQAGNDPETLPSDPNCYNCNQVLGRY